MGRPSFLPSAALFVLGACGVVACASAASDDTAAGDQALTSSASVLTSRNDLNRTGANTQEKTLTTANVNGRSFGKVFARNVDGQIYAQPLYVSGVNGKNVVYVVTEHNSIYAFDADDSRADAPPLWTKNVGAPVPSADTQCGLLGPEVGITSTPVIDPDSKTIWFTSRNKENGKYLHKLHALDIATGEPRANGPKVITAKARGTGSTSVNGVITFDGLRQMQRPGLLKVGNRIYLGFASLCDIAPYHGWLLGYDATTLEQTTVHITTPNGGEGGIWNGGNGIAADEKGDIFYTAADVYDRTGQANFNGADNLGNSIVRVRDTGNGAMKVITKFTPFDTRTFSPQDLSLGNGGGILIPGTNLFVAGDKRGQNFLVDRNEMGGTADRDAQIVQKWQGTARGSWGGGVYYKRGNGGIYYLWGIGDRLKAYNFNGRTFDTAPLVNMDTLTGYPGGALSISSDGEKAGSAILWAVRGKRTNAGLAASTGSATLLAFDANDITKQLWSSDDAPADVLGDGSKFAPPTIVNGRVFVGTSSKQLVVYGLRNGSGGTSSGGTSSGGTSSGGTSSGGTSSGGTTGAPPTFTKIYAELLGPSTPGHCGGPGRCHSSERGGFKCGTSKETCFQGLVDAGLINPAKPAESALGLADQSPLAWFGGSMPLDNSEPNDAAAALLKAWIAGGAKND